LQSKAHNEWFQPVIHEFSRVNFVAAIALMALWIPASVLGQEFSGFLDDYSNLEQVSEWEYVDQALEGESTLQKYTAIMIDQPEFVVAEDSKYKGMKPDDMKLISDTFRLVLIKELERSKFRLVTTPGSDTVFLRAGITDVHLKKKRKRLIQFTPIGLVATVATIPLRDVMDKIDLQEVSFEAELIDSVTWERLGALVERVGVAEEKDEQTSWEDFTNELEAVGGRLACRLNNISLPEGGKMDCMAEFPFG
jgi:hypothetical protein